MKDIYYQKHLNNIANFPKSKEQNEGYLNNYWLFQQELNEKWLKIKGQIFNHSFMGLFAIVTFKEILFIKN